MRRRLNYKVLLITLAVLSVIGGTFHFVHSIQVDRNRTSLLTYAREAKAAKKLDQAISHYEEYLKLAPDDRDVQEEFAAELDAIAETPADRNRVAALYESLLLKSADRPIARNRLVENLILLGRYDSAARQLEILRSSWPDPAEIEHKRGWCLDADGKFEAAAQAYQKAVEIDPKRVASWLLLTEVLHHRLARDVDAQKALDKMVAANPESAAAALARYRYDRMLGRDADAAKNLDQARRLAANDADVILATSQWAQYKGNFDDAREIVADGIKRYPGNESMIREVAALELRQNNPKKALEVVQAGVKQLGDKTRTGELQVLLADLLIDAGDVKTAAGIVAKLRQQGLAPALPDFLQARLLMAEKKWSDALPLLEKTRSALALDPYWNSRTSACIAICAGHLGETDRQLDALQAAARSEPNWPALNFSLGQAQLDAGNVEQALVFLRPLLGDAQAPRGSATLFARALFLQALQRPEKQRPWKEVDAAVAVAAKRDAGSLDVALLRADVLQAQHKLDAARAILNAEIKTHSAKPADEDLAIWLTLADLESRSGDYDLAADVLQSATKLFGYRAGIRLSTARLLMQRGQVGDRELIKTLADKTDTFTPEERGRLSRELAELWLRQGDTAAARSLLVRAADDLPRDLRSRALLVDLDLQESKLDDARKWLKEMQAVEKAGGQQSTFAAFLISVEENYADREALQKLLEEVKKSSLRRDDGRKELIEARIYERLGNTEQAQQALIEAVGKGQRSPRVLRNLVRILSERRDYEQLPWAISMLEGRGSLPREVGRANVEVALAKNDVPHARELLGPVDLDAIRDYRELLWLARTYQAMRDSKQAERALRHAVGVAPYTPETWVTLARFLVNAGKRPQAAELLGDIDRKTQPAKNRPLIRARLLQELGDLKGADAAYETAVMARPTDFLVLLDAADYFRQSDQPAIAEALYKKVLKPSLATPAEIAARARRGYALTLAAKSPSQATATLAPNMSRNDLADVRLNLYLEGLDPARQAAAIAGFEKSLSRGPLTPEEAFWFGQLLDAAGQFDAVATRLDALIAEDKDTPQMLAFYAKSLLRRGKVDDARRVIGRLVQREPDSPRSKDLQTKLAAK